MQSLKSYRSKGMFLLYIVLTVSHRLLGLLIPVVTQKMVDSISQGAAGQLHFYGLLDLTVTLLFILALSASNYVQECYENATILTQKRQLLSRLSQVPYLEFCKNGSGYYLQRFQSDVEGCRPFILKKKVNVWIQGIYLAALMAMMMRINLQYALLLFLVFPLIAVCYRSLAQRIGRLTTQLEGMQDRMNSHVEEMVHCTYSLRANNAMEWFASRIDPLLLENFQGRRRHTKTETIYDFVLITGLLNLLSVAVYYFGGVLVLRQQVTLGMVVAMSLYYSKLWSPLEFYLDYPKERARYLAHRSRLDEILQSTGEDSAPTGPLPPLQQLQMDRLSYQVEDRIILRDLSLTIRQGDRIGVIGENGSGKTTLANLLCGLLRDYRGKITFNGVDCKAIPAQALRERICLIPALPQLFAGTVRENILMGSTREIPPPLVSILERKGLALDAVLREHGSNLSGGEAKLIQLARGIYRDCDLYIIDEPLNYIDENYTQLILQAMQELFAQKTLIIISHDQRVFSLCQQLYRLSGNLTPYERKPDPAERENRRNCYME